MQFIRRVSEDYAEVEFAPNQLQSNFCGSLVRFASFTTMMGRCWLFELLQSIGYDNIFYCDTDSCVFKPEGLQGMNRKIGKEMGDIAP